MSYENAVPKPLKFLISDGKMIDDEGNVIAESDTLKDLYTKWNPEVKKYLLSDGSVVDEEGNLIVKNDYYKKVYDQATPKVAKYLHADGTIDENSGGSSVNLQDNKSVNISSAGSIEIEPDNGYDGMKKVTANVTVSGTGTAYAWVEEGYEEDDFYLYFDFNQAPQTIAGKKELVINGGKLEIGVISSGTPYEKITDEKIMFSYTNYIRKPTRDIILW